MLTVSDETVLKVWDTHTWTTLLTIWEANHAVISAVFSPDGKRVISAGQIVQVRDSNTGKRLSIQPGHTADIYSVVYSPDGKRLLTTSGDYTIRVWDVMSGAELLVITPRAEISTPDGAGGINLIAGQNDLESIIPAVYSPDGTQIANGGNYARVWDAETGAELFALNSQDDFVMSVAYSPDGKRLAVATGAKIRILQANNGEEILQVQDIDNLVIDVDFSPDGNFIVSVDGSQTGSPVVIRIWDAATGTERFAIATTTYTAEYIAFSPDSTRLIGQDGEQAKIWNVADGTELLTIGENVASSEAHFSADGQHLATLTLFGGEVRLWQAHTGTELLRLPSERVSTLRFSPNSQSLAVAGYTIRTWPVKAAPSLPTLQEGEVADLSAVDALLHAAQKRMQRP